MDETVQVQIDKQGDLVLSADIRERLGLTPGMTFVAEEGEQGQLHLRAQQALPQVIEKDGVLIVTPPLSPDMESPDRLSPSLTDAVRQHREQRLALLRQSAERGRLTVREFKQSGILGLWKDRTDIEDSSVYARQLREQAQKRGDIS